MVNGRTIPTTLNATAPDGFALSDWSHDVSICIYAVGQDKRVVNYLIIDVFFQDMFCLSWP